MSIEELQVVDSMQLEVTDRVSYTWTYTDTRHASWWAYVVTMVCWSELERSKSISSTTTCPT
jgi:hypothetical protein